MCSSDLGIYVEKMLEEQEIEVASANHSLVIMLPDNSTTAVEIPSSAFDSSATTWNLTQKGLDELQLDYNYTGAGSITNISGHETNTNWSWTLQVWNASNGSWEPASANATEIPLTDSVHAAWMPGNANTSDRKSVV